MTQLARQLTAAALMLTLPAMAHAQIDVNTNNQAFELRGPIDPAIDPRKALEERFLTGDGDLLLLKERDLFEVRSVTDLVFTNNARLTNTDRVDDVYVREEVALRVNTQIDRTWDVYAESGLIFTRFFDETDLNTNVPFVRIGASTPLDEGPLAGGVLGGSLTGNFIFDDEFEDRLINQFVVTGFYIKPYQLEDNWTLVPRFVWSYTLADPDDFSNFTLTGGADLIKPLRDDLAWVSGVDIYGSWYEDYFQDVFTEDRRDFGVRSRTELRWTINEHAVLRGIVAYNTQNSTIDFLDFDEFSVALSLRLTAEF